MKRSGFLLVAAVCGMLIQSSAYAAVVFTDNFTSGPSSAWGNEIGGWYGHDGVYDTTYPSNNPTTYSSVTTLPNLTDFTVEMDINSVRDGGVWLRSPGAGQGVLLVTYSDRLYWHIVTANPEWTIYGNAPYSSASPDISLKIVVAGNEYKAYVNGGEDPVTVLNTSTFSSGKFALYDYSSQTFDNVTISTPATGAVPEPASLALLGIGLFGLAGLRRKNA